MRVPSPPGSPSRPPRTLQLLDVAHNEPAIGALLPTVISSWPDARLVVVFGANSDKDTATILRMLGALPRVLLAVAVRSSHPKALTTDDVVRESAACAAEAAESDAHASPAPWRAASSMIQALEIAAGALDEDDKAGAGGGGGGEGGEGRQAVVLCTGSVFVVADMREALAAAEPSLFADNDWVFEGGSREPALLM